MEHSNYQLPNFINVIYKKVESILRASNIDLARFLQFCLAVQLFHLKRYRDTIVGLPFSRKDEDAMDHLCAVCSFHSEEYDQGGKGEILVGLSRDTFSAIIDIELLVNRFCEYEVLKEYCEESPSLEEAYETVCVSLESLRRKFKLPARFKYNKFKKRDNPFFKGKVEVIIPERTLPEPKDTVTPESFAISPENAAE